MTAVRYIGGFTRRRRSKGAHRPDPSAWSTFAWRVVFVVAVVIGLELMNRKWGTLVMPSPFDVADVGSDLVRDGTLGTATKESLIVFLGGYLLAVVSGIALGVMFGAIRRLGEVLDPFLHGLNSTPRVAFVPLIIVWFGLKYEAKIVIAWLTAVFPIIINTYAGIQQAEPKLIEAARSFGANRRSVFWNVMLPSSTPYMLAGLRIGAALAIIGTIVGELYTAQSGLGGLLRRYGNSFRMAEYFAVVVVLITIGVIVTQLLKILDRRTAKWSVVREP